MKLREVFIPLLEPELLTVASMDFPDLPPPGSDAWCDYLAEWKGNISRFPTLVTDELVQQCLLNDVSREYIETTTTHQWLALVLLVIPLAGVIGNSLVCIAVWQERRLHNVTNFFLVSLALADLMVCLAVMPFGVLELFYGYWPFSTFVCTLWVTCDVLGCSASILHLCCISVGRYIGIRNPLRTRQRTQYTSRRSVLTRVAGVWILASVISCPLPLLAAHDIENVRPTNNSCAINNRFFLVFGSICAFYLPMIVMVIIYFLTVHELHKPPDLATGDEQQQQQQQLEPREQQSPTPSRSAAAAGSGGFSSNGNTALGVSFSRITSTKANGSASSTETCPCILAVRTARALNERRATKVLGVVFLLFFVCWSPFFVLNVVQVPFGSDFFPSYIGTGFLWLGYLSSTVNPLVYTVFNRVFRSTFWQLLTCRCGKRRRRLLYTNTIRGQSYGTSKDVVSWSFRSTYRQRADAGLVGGPTLPGHPERP